MKILVTGANGFVGTALLEHFGSLPGIDVTGVSRSIVAAVPKNASIEYVDSLDDFDQLSKLLNPADVVIHAAGKAHVMKKQSKEDLEEYDRVNSELTFRLARSAATCGVKRFIYLSSIKVNGESTKPGTAYRSDSIPHPVDAYGKSKLSAEKKLLEVAEETGLEVVIIRPPLVYGPGVKGNMEMLTKLVRSGFPLPFRSIQTNKRSMVSLDNLLDLLKNCLVNPAAPGEIFLVSDDHDLSTFEVVSLLKKYTGSRSLLLPFPRNVFHLLSTKIDAFGKVGRLIESLEVDITHTKRTLGWSPPKSVEECFEKMVN